MNELYMTVNSDSKLYADYYAWISNLDKIKSCYDEVCDTFGIESTVFYLDSTRLKIEPTESDLEKFSDIMLKDECSFKKNSVPSKLWLSLIKDIDIISKPKLFYYMTGLYGWWKESLFHVDDTLYCRICIDIDFDIPEFCTQIKASDFYAAFESTK